MKAIIFFILITLLTIPIVFGQIKIGDNPQNIDPASVLELESSSKVLVITRVNSLEMEAITPQRGGIVYNTDTECINYYDGTQWINLCDAVNFTITNDPIINNRATIEITQTESGYNLEIAKDGILGDNIVDGGIGPDDIQDNSITQDKLAAESVGSSEIRQNAVGSDEIRDGSIAPTDMANFIAGQVLITDENGIVKWGDAGDLMGAVGDEITITGSGTPANPLVLTEGVQLNISNNTALIEAHIADDQDTDETNELIDLTFTKLTNTLSISQSATPVGATVDLSNLVGSDDQQLSLVNNILTLEEGGTPIDLTTYVSSDNQNLGTATLANEQLTINIQNGNPTTANLSAFATDVALNTGLALKENLANKSNNATLGTSTVLYPTQNAVKVYVDTEIADVVTSGGSDPVNEQNQTFEVVAGELRITDVAGTLIVPLTDIDTNTQLTDAEIGAFGYIKTDNDNQTITDLSFDDPSSILSITIEGGNTETVNLGSLAGGTDGVVTLMELQGTDLVVTGTAPGFNGIVPLASLANIADGSETKINSTASITVVGDGTTGTPYELTAVTTNPIAADVIFTPVGNTTSNEVQAAIEELQTEIDGISLGGTANPNDELISDFTLNTTTLTITEAGVDWSIDLDTELATDDELAAAIATSELADGDTSNTNEIQAITSIDGSLTINSVGINDFDVSVTNVGSDDQNLESAILTGTDLAINIEGGNDVIANLETLATDLEVAAAITASETADGDTSDTNEIQPLISSDGTVGVTANGIGFDISVPGSSDDQNLESAILTGTDLAINIEGGNDVIANLETLATDLEVAAAITASETADGDTSDTNEIQPLISSDGTVGVTANGIGFDISVPGSSDDQNLESAILTGTDLAINIEGGSDVTANLETLATDLEVAAAITASETADGDTSDTNEIQPLISSDGTVGITANGIGFDISVPGSSDDQNLESAILTGTDLAINIEGGNDVIANLETLATDLEVAAAITAAAAGSISSASLTIGGGANTTFNNVTIEIPANSITQGELANNSVGPGELRSNAVSSDEIENGTVQDEDLAFGIDGNKVLPNFGAQNIVTTGNVTGNDITANNDIFVTGTVFRGINDLHPDYVFQKYFLGKSILNPEYEYSNLSEIEEFVKQNNHLPGIKSAAAIKEQGFWDLGEASRINLEKIEELFLHTIEQEKKIKELENTNNKMASEVATLKAQMEEIKKLLLEKTKE